MPDYSMCNNTECPLRKTCYRYLAKPSGRQSFCIFKYENEKCDDYMDSKSRRDLRKVKDVDAQWGKLGEQDD